MPAYCQKRSRLQIIGYDSFMRLAVLADVHGNVQALEAVLEHAQKQNVDQIIIAGDLINYLADSRACWDVVMSLNLPVLRGNHERYIFHYNTPFASPEWYGENFKSLPWHVKQFTEAERQSISALPLHLRFDNLLITHATYRADNETISPETPAETLEAMFAGSTEHFIIRGHNHRFFRVTFKDRMIESLGSAGLPLDGTPEAKYGIAEQHGDSWTFFRHAVPYDVAAAIKRVETSGLLETGPIAKIALRELQNSRDYLVRFVTKQDKWTQDETLTLEQAVDAFLAAQE
jgi:predicted phosphodiesterase